MERVNHRPEERCDRGYTIVELLIAMVTTMFIMAAIATLMLHNQRTYEQQSDMADVQQAARVALDLMTREIRMAGSDPSQRAFNTTFVTGCGLTVFDQLLANNPDNVGRLTIARPDQIRVKMDRSHFTLPPEPVPSPLSPAPKRDCNADTDYLEDDEDDLGDGFLNDEGEDIEYCWDATAQVLYRAERRLNPPQCRPCVPNPTPVTVTGACGSAGYLPIADHVIDFELKYYESLPNDPNPYNGAPCPTPDPSCTAPPCFADTAAFEAARDQCDPPAPDIDANNEPDDYDAVRRVRIRLVIETARADPFNLQAGSNRNQLSLSSEATMRNGLMF